MPSDVIEVSRRERPGWLGRLDPFPLLATLRISLRRARHSAAHRHSRAGYRTKASPAAPQHRMPVLVADAHGEPRCVACGLCAFACPPRCLTVVPGEHPSDPASRRPERFELELGRCMLCGLCEEACPEQAIVMRSVLDSWLGARGSLDFDLESLLVPEALLVKPSAADHRAANECDAGAAPTREDAP